MARAGLIKKQIVDKTGKRTSVWVKVGGAPSKEGKFKDWFKGSKVVGEKGNPMTVYHRTNTEFDEFDKNKQSGGWLSKGFYFAEDKNEHSQFGKIIVPVYLSLKSPFIIEPDKIKEDGSVEWMPSAKEQIFNKYPKARDMKWQDVSSYLEKKGYDGIIQGGVKVVFSPKQIWKKK